MSDVTRILLMTAGTNGTLFWNPNDWTCQVLTNTFVRGNNIALAPDGGRLALSNRTNEDFNEVFNAQIQMWDVKTGSKKVIPEKADTDSMAISPDGRWLACGHDSGDVSYWDLANWSPGLRFRAHQGLIYGLSFSPDGQRLATGGMDQQIQIWGAGTTNRLGTHRGHLGEIWSLDFSRDGDKLVSVSRDGTARLWSTKPDASPLSAITIPVGLWMNGPTLDHSAWITTDFRARTFQTWSLPDGRLTRTLRWKDCDPLGDGFKDAFQPPGDEWMGGVTANGTVRLYSHATGALLRSVQVPETNFALCSISPNARWVVGLLSDLKTGVLFDLRGEPRPRRIPDFDNAVSYTGFSPDSRLLAYATLHYDIKLWDLEAGQDKATLKGHAWFIDSLGFSPDGKLLASGGRDGDMWLWSVGTGRALFDGPLKGHQSGVAEVAFSSDNRTLATYGYDRTLRWWSIASGQEMLVFPGLPAWFVSPFDSLAPWHPGGRFLLWYDQPGQMRITTVPSLAEIDATESQEAKNTQPR
jgi:WD40 repeat protein